jgi:alpha-ketoglutarate-dependent taurine dioxygenase
MSVTAPVHLTDDVVLTPFGPGGGLPLFIQPKAYDLVSDAGAFLAWFRDNGESIDALITRTGALVLRGFAVTATAVFSELMREYGSPAFGYAAGVSSRRRLVDRVYESTNVPKEDVMMFHQEMAYLPNYPLRLAFYCQTPPVSGGETLLADMRKVMRALPAQFVQSIQDRGVLYTTNFRDRDRSSGNSYLDIVHRPWQDTFSTESRPEAEATCRAIGLGAAWLDDDSLSVTYRAPGIISHPQTGERAWFNMISTYDLNQQNIGDRVRLYEVHYGDARPWPFEVAYGDGILIERNYMSALYAALRSSTVSFSWRCRDVLLIDNILVAHGRNSYAGERNVQVVLGGERVAGLAAGTL